MTTVTLASDAPLTGFSDCHRGIVCGLRAFASLAELVAAASRARTVASATLLLFENSVLPHHADEESGLFPAVLRGAAPGEELARVEALIARLTAEHRSVEALWKTLKPAVRRAARGGAADLDSAAVAALVCGYNRHVAYEELEFLPLAAEIVRRDANHMAALGLSLHLRHAPQPMAYI